jgi:hypothetical protein
MVRIHGKGKLFVDFVGRFGFEDKVYERVGAREVGREFDEGTCDTGRAFLLGDEYVAWRGGPLQGQQCGAGALKI